MSASKSRDNPDSSSDSQSCPWYLSTYFQYGVACLLILCIIFVFYQVAFLLSPIANFISVLLTPILIACLFYYLLRPCIYLLEKWRIPRVFSIICIYIAIAWVIVLFFAYLVPVIAQQLSALADISVETFEKIKTTLTSILFSLFNINLDQEIQQRFIGFIQQITTLISHNMVDIVSFITRLATILVVIPFILFYLLKDDRDFAKKFSYYFSEEVGIEVNKILYNIDDTISNYVNGMMLVAFSIGGMLLVGYLIIGLDYALILALLAMVFTTIPFLGAFLAITPAILVAFTQSPWMVLKVIITFLIIQQTESNIISPQIIGQRLNIHPLTLILLLVAAGSLYGIVGLILATPVYAITKVLVENFYKIYLIRRK